MQLHDAVSTVHSVPRTRAHAWKRHLQRVAGAALQRIRLQGTQSLHQVSENQANVKAMQHLITHTRQACQIQGELGFAQPCQTCFKSNYKPSGRRPSWRCAKTPAAAPRQTLAWRSAGASPAVVLLRAGCARRPRARLPRPPPCGRRHRTPWQRPVAPGQTPDLGLDTAQAASLTLREGCTVWYGLNAVSSRIVAASWQGYLDFMHMSCDEAHVQARWQ